MDTKLIYPVTLPSYLIDRFNITDNTVFIARFEEGQILIETLTDSELEDYEHTDFEAELEDSFDEWYVEGKLDGFDDGYEQGYRDSSEGNKYDPDYERFEASHHNTDDYPYSAELEDIPSNAFMKPQSEISLRDFLDRLSTAEKRAALVYLSVKYAEGQRGAEDAD